MIVEDTTHSPGAPGSLSSAATPLNVGPGYPKRIIAGVHFLPLPGSPGYDHAGGVAGIIQRARRDTNILCGEGVDALLFANEADTPYPRTLAPETLATFVRVVTEVTAGLRLPFGINALLDVVAGLSIAHATGASFIRGYFAGVYSTESGLIDTDAATALRLRAAIGRPDIQLFHNLVCVFGAPLAPRPIGEEAHGARVHSRVDGFTISGPGSSTPPAGLFEEVREAVPDAPILVGTGVTAANVTDLLRVADGAIVVSSLRENGAALNPVDPTRVSRFMHAARG